MALTYSPVELRGKAAAEVLGALFFENSTVADGIVGFEDNVKAQTIFTEVENSVTLQSYSSGAPTSQGSLGATDTLVTPVKYMAYVEFDPETLRKSRFNTSMQAGAWNILSSEFEQKVLGSYASQISAEAEYKFWNGATSATKSTISGLVGATTQEKALAAAAPASDFDGVVTKLTAGLKRQIVSGTTITSANIATEYAKAYAKVADAKLLASRVKPVIYAPKSHEVFINTYNTNATYRDVFGKDASGNLTYNGIVIKFVPFASDNIIVIAVPNFISWTTDLESDLSTVKIERIAPNREDMFLKAIFTLEAYVGNQKNIVLYVG